MQMVHDGASFRLIEKRELFLTLLNPAWMWDLPMCSVQHWWPHYKSPAPNKGQSATLMADVFSVDSQPFCSSAITQSSL